MRSQEARKRCEARLFLVLIVLALSLGLIQVAVRPLWPGYPRERVALWTAIAVVGLIFSYYLRNYAGLATRKTFFAVAFGLALGFVVFLMLSAIVRVTYPAAYPSPLLDLSIYLAAVALCTYLGRKVAEKVIR